MPQRRTWTDADLTQATAQANCWSDICRGLGLSPTGSNFKTVRKYVEKLSLSVEHFDYAAAYKNRKTNPPTYTLEEVLVEHSYYNTGSLKRRLIKAGLLEYKCARCGIDQWLKEPIVLQLDHINGVNTDNRLENLRLLCPNCHSRTPTFTSKNIALQEGRSPPRCPTCSVQIQKGSKTCLKCHMESRRGNPKTPEVPKNRHVCCDCGTVVSWKASRCKSCVGFTQKSKIPWPPLEELLQMVRNASYLAVGRKLGVSDNAVRKHLRKRGVMLP